MPRNTVTEQFRQSATEDQWRELVSDHENLSKDDFEAKYNFSWSSIMNDAAERGYYEKKRQRSSSTPVLTTETGAKMLIVAPQPAGIEKIPRSVQLNKDIYDRLKSLEDENTQYTHAAILNQLLDDALKLYGH